MAPLVANPTGPGCIRGSPAGGVVALTFPSPVPIREVKIAISALAFGAPDAFNTTASNLTLNDVYVDGISVTAGNPRVHVLSLATGINAAGSQCPCNSGAQPKAFTGTNVVCDEATGTPPWNEDDPMFDFEADAQDCSPLASDPIDVVLAAPVSGAVEVRIMTDEPPTNEDIALLKLAIFVR